MRPARFAPVVLLCAACAATRPVVAVATIPREGEVSYRAVVAPAGQDRPIDGEGRPQEFVPPTASSSNRPPVFPADALDAHCPTASVTLRVIVDGHGGIGEVRNSPLAAVERSACVGLYRQAADTAIRGWSFAPAYRQMQLKAAGDGAFGQPEWTSETIPWFVDFTFRFEIVDGRGQVVAPNPR